MADRQYERLTRWHNRRLFTLAPAARSSLWLGKDHVLRIDSSYFTEEYKRFYFRDIQALTIRKTGHREGWNVAFVIMTLLVIAVMSVSSGQFISTWPTMGILMLLLLAGMAINNFQGATCVVHIRTAVQSEQLSALNRLPRAQRFLNRIRPLVAMAQGTLPPQEIATLLNEVAHHATASGGLKIPEFKQVPTSPLNLSIDVPERQPHAAAPNVEADSHT